MRPNILDRWNQQKIIIFYIQQLCTASAIITEFKQMAKRKQTADILKNHDLLYLATKLVNFHRLIGKITDKTILPIYRLTVFTNG